MKIEIDLDEIVKKMNINKTVEENIISNITDIINFECIAADLINDNDVKKNIDKKILAIIEEYILSDEGKRYIIDIFKDKIDDSDILTDDAVINLVAEFLKKTLTDRY